MLTKEEAVIRIQSLVERFDEQKAFYQHRDYNETQTRRDFIDPFWKALGWDVDNENGYAESYREVIHEDRIKVGGATKAPDYSFRLPGGKRLFFLEAKKPSVAIKDDVEPAYQIRRYGWSAKMPISVITDFEEFAIYDCSNKPKPTDKASNGRIKYLTYNEYITAFDFIWDTFSKERVLKGSFDKYILSDRNKKGTTTVDRDFLQSLDKWRVELARNIALRNKNITEDELNFVVQLTIDRIVFLRIAEDRGAEQYGELQNAISAGKGMNPLAGNYYQNLLRLFYLADEKYNSGLFDFDRDRISAAIAIDNKVIKSIVSEFYYPLCPYEFSVLPVEILGSAYEQFLGKSISLSKSGRATIEEKPEVRKAGGVYYTPQYIVDYIVQNTVGKLLSVKTDNYPSLQNNGRQMTPEDVSKIKIVDPACGSGSFLIGAYQYLLNWHKDYYTNAEHHSCENRNAPKKRKIAGRARNDVLTPKGELTTAEKKRILLNNIYGVDLDSNAVEVTKLSLLLKCMEGETQETIEAQKRLFHDRVLPSLYNNIKSGNSLIDLDYYDSQLDFGEERKIKPFSWQRNFPEVFAQSGFDCVIGNPPWGADFSPYLLNYLKEKNREIIVRMIDSFMYFVYKSYELLKEDGNFGMILPDVLFYQTDNEKLREYILNHSTIIALLNLGDVFEKVTRPSGIIIFSKSKEKKPNEITTVDLTAYKRDCKHIELYEIRNYQSILQKEIKEIPNFLFVTKNAKNYNLLNKITKGKVKILSDFVDEDGIQRGVSPDYKDAFLVTSEQVEEFHLEKSHLRNVLTGGKHVKRFNILYPDLQLIYTNRSTNFKNIPNICKFINQFKSNITCKEVKGGKHSMYALHRSREEKIFTKSEKLIGVITEDEIVVSLDNNKTFATDGLYLFGTKNINSKFLMGILNSNLFVFLYRLTTMESGRTLAQVKPTVVAKMPIRVIDEANKNEIQQREQIIKHVDQLLLLNKELLSATLPEQREMLKHRIEYIEGKIDEAVYGLYGLTDEEIEIIKGG